MKTTPSSRDLHFATRFPVPEWPSVSLVIQPKSKISEVIAVIG
jgi:hypothetical protein